MLFVEIVGKKRHLSEGDLKFNMATQLNACIKCGT